MTSDAIARDVLAQYPSALGQARIVVLADHGGFSGARLWRVAMPAVAGQLAAFCLRAWPPGSIAPVRLSAIHRLTLRARAAGLCFIPAVISGVDGLTWMEHAGRLWDLTDWMPGTADFRERPTRPRLEAACAALARLHRSWADERHPEGPCPGVARRLEAYQTWERLCTSGWQPRPAEHDPVQEAATRAWLLVKRWSDDVPRDLAAWIDRPVPLQPCLCDVWHAHVLYEGDAVTGIVDFGSVKLDNVAVDLARLLGSLIEDDRSMHAAGLEAYARIRPLSELETSLIPLLDRTGVLIGMANWLRWLYADFRDYEDRHAVARRLEVLVQRVEGWC